DIRTTVSNSDGYFTFAAVPVGTYEATVEAAGFQTYVISGLGFTGADKRNLDIVLKVGSTSEKVEVTGAADLLSPSDSGEKSAVLTTKQLQDFSVVGRSAAEFIKILPGFAISNTGTENRANFTGETIGINGNGEGGSQSAFNGAYSVNGQPGGSLDITADGSHVSDPGCNCATPVNPNTDMIQEFKVLTSNFSAENSKGPAVVSSVSKSGGRDFHGGAYMYARHYSMNSNGWVNNRLGLQRPQNRYFFPGGNIGGPVLIPGTKFNKNRDKLFFFTGYEHYFQRLDTGVLRATVPTDGMRADNYSPGELSKLGNITSTGAPPSQFNGDAAALFPGGIIPANRIDPTGRAITNLYPKANANPNSNGGYNYVDQLVFDQNSIQSLSRVDYSISDNTKLFVRYNLQAETQRFPVSLWWRPQGGNSVPYPTSVLGKNRSHSVSASLTHVFSPTLTNEFVFGYTYITFPNSFEDPGKVDRTKLGAPFKGLFKNGVSQLPAALSWGGQELAGMFNPGGFEAGGSRGLFADKYLPTFSNNVSKVWGTHTVKMGGFYEYIINNQPANDYTNGLGVFANWGGNSTGNSYADLLTGRTAGYEEASFNRLNNIGVHIFEGFVQDSWKVSRRLTLDLGLRVSHYGRWSDREGFGFAIFDQSKYNANALPTEYSGFLWNKRDSSVPLTGFKTRTAFFAPRVGAAYDLFGTGKTVLRGGWGRFFYPTPQFTTGLAVSAGVRRRSIGNTTFAEIDATPAGAGDRLGVAAVDGKNDNNPYTDSYSFTVAQRLPFSSLMEVAYVGNRSRNQLNNGGPGSVTNLVPAGTLLRPGLGDPQAVSQDTYDSFRPLRGFQDFTTATFGLYQNYNSMQVTWVRTKGRYNLNTNYTWSKSMGITGNGDLFNVENNYGVMPGDRRHLFNAAYSVELGNFSRNKIAGGFVNGWQLSGISQIQSGINLAGNTGNNFNLNVNGATFANSGYLISARSVNGTDSIALRPKVSCTAQGGGGTNQFVNGNCFSLPTGARDNGPTVMAPVYGPAFMNHDLGLFKNFQISESKKLQFRFNAYNFLNNPLWSFNGGTSNLNLIFDPQTRKLSNPNFGVATEKQGRRIVQLALKFYF
ncbi:MAG: carboxypeptidase regulatory-like domain-containing protein, partial [Acidobacteria bacterium]|nr:carboxypeptidase regulatory-like domain-containing protein [Acidobacteriota bacterium]